MYTHNGYVDTYSGVVMLCRERYPPREQFVDLADGVVGDPGEDMVELVLWVEPVELG
jgi:hypothetical protein